MSLFKKLLKSSEKNPYEIKKPAAVVDDDEERRRRDDLVGRDGARNPGDDEARRMDGTEVIYYALGPPQDRLVEVLKALNKDVQVSFIFVQEFREFIFLSRHLRRKQIVLIISHQLRIKFS